MQKMSITSYQLRLVVVSYRDSHFSEAVDLCICTCIFEPIMDLCHNFHAYPDFCTKPSLKKRETQDKSP